MKRVHTDNLPTSTTTTTTTTTIEEQGSLPPRPNTPPLGMTLSHYDSSTGAYTSSQLNSMDEVNTVICSGMTPVYKPSFERFGSYII
ncbi:hypothetical protein BD770DRAFT_5060 [Pilaira anomala]|nr:hypothetical protein BD770DRAFT_5060 [Pilaira anomala]